MRGMMSIAFGGLGALFLGLGLVVIWRNNLRLVPNMTKEKIKKIKKCDKLMQDYSRALVLMSLTCFLSAIVLNRFYGFGPLISMVAIICGAINLNKFIFSIDNKIKENIY